MPRRITLVAATAALAAAAGAVPTTAAAADVQWRCTATPLSGTLLGQQLPAPTIGSPDGGCRTQTTLPTVQLPSLLDVDALSGVTAVSRSGAFAGAGLSSLSVGSVSVPIDEIPVPEALRRVEVPLPGTSAPIATVDLAPAIEAVKTLPSRSLLDAGLLHSTVTGTCRDGAPEITGASRILAGEVLGLPIDPSRSVESTVDLLDTSQIALGSLDLRLARVTLLGGVLGVDAGRVRELLKPIVAQMPPLQVPPQLARVKLTPATQDSAGGMLVQRALHAEVSVAGRSLADLSIGRAAVGARDACAPAPQPELECTKRKLALIDVVAKGDRVRLFGAADRGLAGRTVRIVFAATNRTVARARVRRDGSFAATAPLPAAAIRDTNEARYVARVGHERSLNLKLMRRMVVDAVRSRAGRVTISGRVIGPFAPTPQTITLKRRVTCRELKVVKRFKPGPDGTFRVTVKSPENLAAAVYRLQTRVRQSAGNPKLYPTFTLPRAVDL